MAIPQNEITQRKPLFDENGFLADPGWGRKLYFDFDPTKMAAAYERHRAWDYYFVGSEKFGIAISIAFVGTFSRAAIQVLDFENNLYISEMIVSPEDILQPAGDDETVFLRTPKGEEAMYIRKPGKCYMKLNVPGYHGEGLSWDITLDIPETDRMMIATPFAEGRELFFYNEKLNCMRASGKVRLGQKEYRFQPDRDFAVLDYGRGVWPEHNRWYWASASGEWEGKLLGFNLGYGFGDLSHATENMIFYDGKAHKFDEIFFHIPVNGFTAGPWHIVSNDGRFDMQFVPMFDRQTICDITQGGSLQHQVFGHYTGKAVLDDGTVLNVKDFFGFAEDVINNWSVK